jgi:tetratricopeptide (TPR) repeat protein
MLLAFGRYLKMIRERRKLSLEDVATLTKSYPEPINKGYLSRVERGLARVGFSKMVALSHAYEVSLDVFGEKLALDLEVDRLKDAPETKGKTFEGLIEQAIRFRDRGMRWHSYACLRDAHSRAGSDPSLSDFEGKTARLVAAASSMGSTASSLGRYHLSLAELEFVAVNIDRVAVENRPIVFQSLSIAERNLGRLEQASAHAEQAVELAKSAPQKKYLGSALQTQAVLAMRMRDYVAAVELEKRAFAAFRLAGSHVDSARSLANLAQNYFDLGRVKAARRALGAADRLARQVDADSTRSRLRILLGEIEIADGNAGRASELWHEALEIARKTHDSVVHFKAEFQLFKLAISQGNKTVINALGRRLERMTPWISSSEPEVGEFKALYSVHRKPKQRSVAAAQLGRPAGRNPSGGEQLS